MSKDLVKKAKTIKQPNVSADKKRIRQLEKLVEQQAAQVESLRSARFTIPAGKKSKGKRGDFTRVIIPDSHGSKIDKTAASAFLHDLELLSNVRELVLLGDHLDCGGFLAKHHTLGYVSETTYTFEDDVAAANEFLDQVQQRAPTADIHYTSGNHERRIERWVCDQVVANHQDATFLRSVVSAQSVLSLEKRGIKYYDQGEFYMGLPIPATIKLGHCYFTHGHFAGKTATAKHLAEYAACVVHGHTHRASTAVDVNVHTGTVAAWSVGCLCVLQPLWQHTRITGWSHGYGVQLVRADGTFLMIPVPIINGRSYLAPLIESIGGAAMGVAA